jgi:hypothetical protein
LPCASETAPWVAAAIRDITINHEIFCTAAMRDALVQLCAAATAPESARWVALAIYNITINTAKKELLCRWNL